jgi:hypothetical protein
MKKKKPAQNSKELFLRVGIRKDHKAWRQGQFEKELIEGYRAMAKEDREKAEANLEASAEVLK